MGFFKIFKRKKNDKYKLGLHKTRESLGTLNEILESSDSITDDLYDQIEEVLIMADIGVEVTLKFMEILRREQIDKNITNPNELKKLLLMKCLIFT